MSDGYPEVWDFEKAAVLQGALVSIDRVSGTKYGTDIPEDKFVANIKTDDGETHAVWLDNAVLKRAFTEEARNRKAVGQRFNENEHVIIEYLGKKKGAQFTYKNFRVEFEFQAPSQDAFDALAGAGTSEAPAPEVEIETAPATEEAPAAATTEAPQNDDIPF